MSKSKAVILIILSGIILILFILRPEEQAYKERIATDYGLAHHGLQIGIEMLEEIGQGQYQNYYLFSTYTYQYGNIGVAYYGLAGYVFFLQSYPADLKEEEVPLRTA